LENYHISGVLTGSMSARVISLPAGIIL